MRLRHGRQDWSHWPLLSCMELQRFGSRKWQCCPFAFNLLNQTPNPKPNKNRQRQLQPSQLVVCGVQLVCFQRSQRKFDSLAPGFGWFYLGVLKIGGSPRKTHTQKQTKQNLSGLLLSPFNFKWSKPRIPHLFGSAHCKGNSHQTSQALKRPKPGQPVRAPSLFETPWSQGAIVRGVQMDPGSCPCKTRLHEFQKTQTQQPMLQLISPGLTPRCLGLRATTRLMAYALRKSVWAVSWLRCSNPNQRLRTCETY